MAEVKYRGSTERNTLHKVLPLDTPYVIGIFTGDICNFKCSYCVQSLDQGMETPKYLVKEFMDMDMFEMLGYQISQFPNKVKTLLFSSMGEPLLNKHLVQMIQRANEMNLADKYEIVTNASLLDQDLVRDLIDAGLTKINISIQGVTSRKYKEICGYDMDIDKLISNLTYVYQYSRGKCKIHIKTLYIALDKFENEIFYKMFSGISDTIYIDSVVESTPEIDFSQMGGKCNNLIGINIEGIQIKCCSPIFYTLYILPNGNVVPCCDPPYPTNYGNIINMPITEIFAGEKRAMFLKAHLEGMRKNIKVCQSCKTPNQLVFMEDDLLDGHEKEILMRMNLK